MWTVSVSFECKQTQQHSNSTLAIVVVCNSLEEMNSFPSGDRDSYELDSIEWVELQNTLDRSQGLQETFWQKARRRTMANPVAPIGLLVACGFLGFGLRALSRGDSRSQQFMMRGRVFSQAIGIGSIMLALLMTQK